MITLDHARESITDRRFAYYDRRNTRVIQCRQFAQNFYWRSITGRVVKTILKHNFMSKDFVR